MLATWYEVRWYLPDFANASWDAWDVSATFYLKENQRNLVFYKVNLR